ncbi:MAG: flagellar hook-basal body complex protein [Alphaproteobacteria bacterium]|nr:flagellar hook-basal body complex protein [Alphaproteobacteria bacterium]MBV9694045.1 flagellar hook-basal body complex protein [Alphaproteobacteria bacterium]
MLGAIYTGLSGMNAYSEGLMMISNDVANLNSMGYKGNFLSFDSLFEHGGAFLGSNSNAGYGVSMGSAFIDFSQGTLQQTTNPLDLAIQGKGFLTVLKDGKTFYERTGNFFVGQDGFVSDAQGNHLAILNSDNIPVEVNIDAYKSYPPAATGNIAFTGNLSSGGTNASVANIKVFDSRGNEHDWTVTFTMSDPATDTWTFTVADASGKPVDIQGTASLQFDSSGNITGTTKFTVTEVPDNADPLNVTLDFSKVTSTGGGTDSTIATSSVDGNATGTLTGAGISSDGQVELAYTNGKTKDIGFVALANFQDPQLLQRLNGDIYANPTDEQVTYNKSGGDGLGTLQSGQIEASNVNLSNEFGELILIERGFQACSQIVSISNEMIQTLFSMQGHG